MRAHHQLRTATPPRDRGGACDCQSAARPAASRLAIDLTAFGGSALTSPVDVPKGRPLDRGDIPVTYVPARNTVFLSLATAGMGGGARRSWRSRSASMPWTFGYPDCRPEFIHAFERLASLATRAGIEGQRFKIETPLIGLRQGRHHQARNLARSGLRADAQLL